MLHCSSIHMKAEFIVKVSCWYNEKCYNVVIVMQIELIRLQIYSALQILVFIFCFHQLETELQFYGDVNS